MSLSGHFRALLTCISVTLLVVIVAPDADAQADSLDWRRYYSLDVGTVREYQEAEAPQVLVRHELVADTVAGGRAYVIRETRHEIGDVPRLGTVRLASRDFLRYDAAGAVVAVQSPDADTVAVAPCSYGSDFGRDLRLAFDARQACPDGADADTVSVQGTYDTVWTPPGGGAVDVAAIKTVTLDDVLFATFVADIGPVSAGNLWGPRLRYARVGGVEYGTPGIIVADEAAPPSVSGLSLRAVSPVRAGTAVRLRMRAEASAEARVEVYDLLGRRVAQREVTLGTNWQLVSIPVSLASGAYRVRLVTDGEQATVPLTVIR